MLQFWATQRAQQLIAGQTCMPSCGRATMCLRGPHATPHLEHKLSQLPASDAVRPCHQRVELPCHRLVVLCGMHACMGAAFLRESKVAAARPPCTAPTVQQHLSPRTLRRCPLLHSARPRHACAEWAPRVAAWRAPTRPQQQQRCLAGSCTFCEAPTC